LGEEVALEVVTLDAWLEVARDELTDGLLEAIADDEEDDADAGEILVGAEDADTTEDAVDEEETLAAAEDAEDTDETADDTTDDTTDEDAEDVLDDEEDDEVVGAVDTGPNTSLPPVVSIVWSL